MEQLMTVTQTNSPIGTIAEQIYLQVRNDILSGKISSDTILKEVSLAEKFHTSRTPAREVLHQLESEHLLEQVPRKGYRVRKISTDDTIQIYDAAIAMEGMAAYLAAQKITTEELAILQSLYDQEQENISKGVETESMISLFNHMNYDLHVRIAIASRNAFLIDGITKIHDNLLMHSAYLVSLRDYSVHTEHWDNVGHGAIINAIASSDAETAKALMEHHFRQSKQNYLDDMKAQEIKKIEETYDALNR